MFGKVKKLIRPADDLAAFHDHLPAPEAKPKRSRLHPLLSSALLWWAALLWWELVLRFSGQLPLRPTLVLVALFTAVLAALLSLLANLPRYGQLLTRVLLALFFLIYGTQLVYHDLFDLYLSLSYLSMGDQVVGKFFNIMMQAVWRNLPRLLLLLVPALAFFLLHRRVRWPQAQLSWRLALHAATVAALLFVTATLLLPAFGRAAFTPYAVYYNSRISTDHAVEYFGVPTTIRLELGALLFDRTSISVDGAAVIDDGRERNVEPQLDFTALNDCTDDKDLLMLNEYFAAQPGTVKNDYTGKFAGYNLILVCAEAFSPYLVDETRTPTLYRLMHEGLLFNNFYNSFPSITSNGEYSLCMGLMPDLSCMSFASSSANYLPFCLGNVFSAAGLPAIAYHNNDGAFYNRTATHPNMGYDFRHKLDGLTLSDYQPGSDVEMFTQSVDDYINEPQFHAYYMTYSGHAYYDFKDNDLSVLHRDEVADLDCSDEVKAYYACQLELEYALDYLVGQLESAGVADRTVIALTGDHYPYGLSDEAYAELAGEATAQPFWKYRNAFICWTAGLEQPVQVDEYCCTQDILPTLLNLFGFDYDSRLLTGTDVFSDSPHLAILSNGSILCDELYFNSESGEVSLPSTAEPAAEPVATADEAATDAALRTRANELIRRTENIFAVSAAVLATDYYRFAFENSGLELLQHNGPTVVANFSDALGTWYEQDTALLLRRGVITGDGFGVFRGDEPTRRAEFIIMLSRALRLPQEGSIPPFTDVANTDWFFPEIQSALAAGLLSADDELLRPYDALSADEAYAMLAAAVEWAGIGQPQDWLSQTLEDVDAQALAAGEPAAGAELLRSRAAALSAALLRSTEE